MDLDHNRRCSVEGSCKIVVHISRNKQCMIDPPIQANPFTCYVIRWIGISLHMKISHFHFRDVFPKWLRRQRLSMDDILSLERYPVFDIHTRE
jgi:hypothetical protein